MPKASYWQDADEGDPSGSCATKTTAIHRSNHRRSRDRRRTGSDLRDCSFCILFILFFFRSLVDKFGVGRGPDWRFANETADTLARKNNTHWLLLFFPLKTTQMFLEWNSRLRLPSCLIVLRIDRLLGGLINVRNGPLFVSERPNLTFRSKSNQGRFRIFFFWLEPVFWKRGS